MFLLPGFPSGPLSSPSGGSDPTLCISCGGLTPPSPQCKRQPALCSGGPGLEAWISPGGRPKAMHVFWGEEKSFASEEIWFLSLCVLT